MGAISAYFQGRTCGVSFSGNVSVFWGGVENLLEAQKVESYLRLVVFSFNLVVLGMDENFSIYSAS